MVISSHQEDKKKIIKQNNTELLWEKQQQQKKLWMLKQWISVLFGTSGISKIIVEKCLWISNSMCSNIEKERI